MNMTEKEMKTFLERLRPLQEAEQDLICPRCGYNELYSGSFFFLNSLSRHADVYICEKCWMDEMLREIDHQPISLDKWSAIVCLSVSGEYPSSINSTRSCHSEQRIKPEKAQSKEDNV